MPGEIALAVAMFLSGAAGLMFQVVWLYRSGLVLGSDLWAITLVLTSFMGGLALGNGIAGALAARVKRPLLVYAALETIVALAGVAVTAILPHLTTVIVPVISGWPSDGPAATGVRLLVAFLVLVVPATAMGATMPVVVGAITRRGRSFGVALGYFYGANTLGACAGVIAAEWLLIARLGVARTAVVAALLNLVAAVIAVAVSRRPALISPHAERDRAIVGPARVVPVLACAFIAGCAALALEVIWFRVLSLYVLSTTQATASMLATVLAAIALGGIAAGAVLKRHPSFARHIPVVALLASVTMLGSYAAFDFTTRGTQVGAWTTIAWFAAALTAPTAFLSGVLFTLIGAALNGEVGEGTRSAAWITLANTLGALTGPPIAAFVLLPRVGMEGAFLFVAGAYALCAVLAVIALRPLPGTAKFALPLGAAVLAAMLVWIPTLRLGARYFARAAAAYSADSSRVVATREGPSETIFLMQQDLMDRPVYHRLVTNGFSMSGTAVPGQRYMRYFAYWPMVMHRGPIERALVVCYGVGVTARGVLDIPSLTSLDVVEISRDIVAMSERIYSPDHHPLRDPRVRVHLQDGRFYLETTTERFDLITGEPPPPRTPGASNIYTREYFQLMFDRLNEGGIATYWVPVGRPNPGTDVDTIIRAFCDVFEDCSLWNATPFDFMLAGSRHARGPVPMEQFSAPWQTPGLQAALRDVGFERPEQLGATFLGDAAFLRELTSRTPPLADDFPQRLRPSADRPSLSDPRYGVDAEVTAHYQRLLDPLRARDRFASSAYVASVWPEALRMTTLPYFETQRVINDVLWDGSHPLAHIGQLHTLLTTTTLRTLPLWLLGSDEVRQRIVEQAEAGSAIAEYAHGIRALTGRDFHGAAMAFSRARRAGYGDAVLPLLTYAVCLSGHVDDARRIAQLAKPTTDDERVFWQWMSGTFGVSPPQ
jgi:spermidine synthase